MPVHRMRKKVSWHHVRQQYFSQAALPFRPATTTCRPSLQVLTALDADSMLQNTDSLGYCVMTKAHSNQYCLIRWRATYFKVHQYKTLCLREILESEGTLSNRSNVWQGRRCKLLTQKAQFLGQHLRPQSITRQRVQLSWNVFLSPVVNSPWNKIFACFTKWVLTTGERRTFQHNQTLCWLIDWICWASNLCCAHANKSNHWKSNSAYAWKLVHFLTTKNVISTMKKK